MAKLDVHKATSDELPFLSRGQEYVAEIRISERNLLSLLVKLYQRGSAATLYNDIVYIEGEDGGASGGTILKLVAEKDEKHYNDSDRTTAKSKAGPMDFTTSSMVEKIKRILEEAPPVSGVPEVHGPVDV